jgi:Uma2 family endonuclease
MTVTDTPPVRPTHRKGVWTIEDLADLPDDGCRYELLDGSLIVTPPANTFHFGAATSLDRVLARFEPADLVVGAGGLGVNIDHRETFYVPDIIVVERVVLETLEEAVEPATVRLVVEVLSRSTARRDKGLKREDYAKVGIPNYWIVDHEKHTLTVLRLDDSGEHYVESEVVRPGRQWKTDEPFPLAFDLAEIF